MEDSEGAAGKVSVNTSDMDNGIRAVNVSWSRNGRHELYALTFSACTLSLYQPAKH